MKNTAYSEEIVDIAGISVLVLRKPVKNLHLRVTTPEVKAVASVPLRLPRTDVLRFLESRANWLRSAVAKVQQREAHNPDYHFEDGVAWLWGQPVPVSFTAAGSFKAELINNELHIAGRGAATAAGRQRLLHRYYRQVLESKLAGLFAYWQPRMGLYASVVHIRTMKSCWGTCNVIAKSILINYRLIHRPVSCLEYVVVHELAHLYEGSHNLRFWQCVEAQLPDWHARRQLLNNFVFKRV